MGHFFVTSSSSHFFNKIDFEQYLSKPGQEMDLALVIAMIYPVYVLQVFLYFVGLSRRGPYFWTPLHLPLLRGDNFFALLVLTSRCSGGSVIV